LKNDKPAVPQIVLWDSPVVLNIPVVVVLMASRVPWVLLEVSFVLLIVLRRILLVSSGDVVLLDRFVII